MTHKTNDPGHYRDLLESILARPAEPAMEGRAPETVELRGRQVDVSSIEIDGVDHRDHPDYSDAYISAATYTDGTPLTDRELEDLHDENRDLVHEILWDRYP